MSAPTSVTNKDSLLAALNSQAPNIEVIGVIDDLPSVRLHAGQSVVGKDSAAGLRFQPGIPGLMLHANNTVRSLQLWSDTTQIALGFTDETEDLGTITVSDIRTVGRFHLEAQNALKGDIKLANIHVAQADARMCAHRPQGFGVEVLMGGLTVYNSSKKSQSRWNLQAQQLSGGSKEHPLRGSGIFIFGGDYIAPGTDPSTAPGPDTLGGQIHLTDLTTGPVFSDGGIPAGVGNLITAGVFIGSGTIAEHVHCQGPVTTLNQNDMVLDNWGKVTHWQAGAPITSQGPSGIGFVNFGALETLQVNAPITTHGLGARGFNLYDGSLGTAQFLSITTHGDGAIGIQLSKPFGRILVKENVTTHGGAGDSLVRGKVINLKAHAISLKPGTQGKRLEVQGQAQALNPKIAALDLDGAPNAIPEIWIAGQKIGG